MTEQLTETPDLVDTDLVDAASATEETLAVPTVELRPALEAVLMVADQPLDHMTLASAVGYPPDEVQQALVALAAEYAEQGRGFDLRNVAGGWRFYTREELASVVETFVLEDGFCMSAAELTAVLSSRIRKFNNGVWGPGPEDERTGLRSINLRLSRPAAPKFPELDLLKTIAENHGVDIFIDSS